MVAIQLGLLALVIRQFEIESAAFLQLTLLTLAGFLVHSFLPKPHRLSFFLCLSLAGIGLVLGLQAGATLVAIGLALIGICHLPASFAVRVTLLLTAAAALAVMRVGWVPVPWSAAIWPILGSMFMFRLCVYLYDLKHDKEPPTAARTLSYFFLLPNVCFPLFPVIDYKTFRRTYYNEAEYEIYQNGIRWMFRGVVQLVLYRVVYYHLTLTPAEVSDLPDLVRYLTSNFLLYLRVSGQFHLVVGMLHLFGFNLPPTHYLYFMASSFNDFWRRINIYWKDFMMKLFYYPAYFKLRRFGNTSALVLSTFFVFLATWLLHSYQWFWLRGSFPLTWQDGAFWGLLAVLVVVNSLYEARHGRSRSIKKRAWTPGALAGVSLRTVGTFCAICVLWSLWTSESFSEWLSLWSLPGGLGLADGRSLVPVFLIGAVWFSGWGAAPPAGDGGGSRQRAFVRSVLLTSLSILALYALGQPAVYTRLGARGDIIESVRSPRLNARDASQLEVGYYEGLLRVDRFNSQLWEVYMRNPTDVDNWEGSGRTIRATNDFRIKELRPNLRTELRDRPFSTNQWGMRDRDYSLVPVAGTRRIALLGSSVVMGSGVADGENFESLIEERLDRERVSERSARYEILNFAVGGYGPLEQVAVLRDRVRRFEPHAVLFVAHWTDMQRAVRHFANVLNQQVVNDPELLDMAKRAGVDSTTPPTEAEGRLRAFGPELVAFAYGRIAAESRARGVLPLWVFLPVLREKATIEEAQVFVELATDAQFHVLDLSSVFEGLDRARLRVSEADYHPNSDGHTVIAEELYRRLKAVDAAESLGLFPTADSQ